MNCWAVSAHFDSRHLFLDLSDGTAVEFSLDRFPALREATSMQRGNFAVTLDGLQLFWPDIDENVSIAELLA